jgi:hypothetical protein
MTYELLLSLFILVIPLFGKAINYSESIIFYGGTIAFFLFSLIHPLPKQISKKFLVLEIILTFLFLLSTIFSKNIGFSYYSLFNFIFSLILLNLSLLYIDFHKLLKYFLYFSLFYSTIFLLNKINILSINPDPVLDNVILQIWGHSYLADFLVFPILFLLYQLLNSKFTSKNHRYFYNFSLIYLLLTIFLTNSRAAIIAISVGTIYIVLPHLTKQLKIPFILLIIALASIINFQSFSQNSYIKSYDGRRLEYWQETTKAFLNRPLLGQGPGNFFYINKKYQSTPYTNTNYAHNSFLEYLALNGIFFTLIFFLLIFTSLLYQHRRQPHVFGLALGGLINSFLDPSWNSIGIFCLSLFFIFNGNPLIISSTKKIYSKTRLLSIITLVLISLFFVSKTASDYFFISNQNDLSLRFDPFNLNPRLATLDKNLPSTINLFPNSTSLYLSLIGNKFPNPDNEKYFLKLISLNPKENVEAYSKLAQYYLDLKDFQKLNQLLLVINNNFISNNHPNIKSLSIAKIAYNLALIEWNLKGYSLAIKHFQQAVDLSYGWSHFHIELANAYWHTNQKDKALNQLTVECQKFPSSIKHCQEYLNQNSNLFLEPGNKKFQEYINSLKDN